MASSFPSSQRWQSIKAAVALFTLAIALFTVLPNYITGNWSWVVSPEVTILKQLKELQQDGLDLPGWQTVDQQKGQIGGRTWSIQTLMPASAEEQQWFDGEVRSPIYLFLRPQTHTPDQPQVEWMDLNGVQQWTVDSVQLLRLDVPAPESQANPTGSSTPSYSITTRFFRGWNSDGTYAVLQWYAWSKGGNPASSRWLWADWRSQWGDRQRMPWIAVSVLIPIKPLGEVEAARPLAEQLGTVIQSTLARNVFSALGE